MKKAFTLIELLVVVLIIGILSAIALPQYTRSVEKSRATEAVMGVSALEKAIDIYLLENGGYPTTTVRFTGNNKQDVLNIDVTAGMNCNADYSCSNTYFDYLSYCSSSECSISIDRSGVDGGLDGYGLRSSKEKGTDVWIRECVYGESKEYLCKGLQSQGYERSSCC